MPTPFPGMDPHLERRGIWEQVHTDLIVSIRRFLTPLLRPRYHVGIEERTYLMVLPPDEPRAGIPDVLITFPQRDTGGATPATPLPTPVTAQPLVAESLSGKSIDL
jgi:hypothetical protein